MNAADKATLAEFCRVDAERAQARLARLEKQAEERENVELLRLSALSVGACPPLTCLCNNISRTDEGRGASGKCYCVKNKPYYDKSAVALQNNVARWCLAIGRRYAGAAASESAALAAAREHLAEFTITIPHYKTESPQDARRRFTKAFNDFNRRFLKERASRYFGEFVRVFEPHKDGVLHAHILIECKQSLRRGQMAFKWRRLGGVSLVNGATVADWVRNVWAEFRGGGLERCGIGKIHTLQPIRKGVKAFSFYVAKYITKNLTARPQYMRGLRVVAYSRDFCGGNRLRVYDYDKTQKIEYYSKARQKWLWRYRRFASFSINCPSARARGQKLLAALRTLGATREQCKAAFGANWYWQLRDIVNCFSVSARWFLRAQKWERLGALVGLTGNKFQAVLRFGGRLIRFEDFLRIPAKEKAQNKFGVVGYIVAGAFVEVKTAFRAAADWARSKIFDLKNKLKSPRSLSELDALFMERAQTWTAFDMGKLTRDAWHAYLDTWAARLADIQATTSIWLPRKAAIC